MKNIIAFTLISGITLSGCAAVGPEYSAPQTQVSAQFVNGQSASLVEAANAQWWRTLNDAKLNDLVARGLAQNLDIATSYERIRAASASLGRTGVNAQTTGAISGETGRRETEFNGITNSTGTTINAGYVFDLFGGISRGREQAVANLEAAQFDTGTVRLAYLSDIVNAYIQARYFQRAAQISQRTVESRRKTLSLVNSRRAVGDATELEVAQARAELSSAKASLPLLKSNFEGNVFRIATLLAEPAGPLLAMMKKGGKQPLPTAIGAVGIPADLVRNRPDVRFSERNFAATTAAVGVAEAQLYPSLSINGRVTEGTLDSWSFGPTISLPLLNRGFLKASRNVAISEARQAQIGWQNSVLIAVEDVQSNLSSTLALRDQIAQLKAASNSSGQVLRLSRESYDGGGTILTDVLDAERFNSSNELAVAAACRDYAASWSRLQVSAGKGWNTQPIEPPIQVASIKK